MALLCPAPAAATTLQDALALAYAGNPVLAEQRLRQRSVNENYVQTRAQYGPTLNLGGSITYNYQNLAGRNAELDQNGVSLSARQPIYSGGRIRGAVESARADVKASQERLRQIEQETVQNVIAVYAAVIRDEQRLSVGRENLAVLQNQLREARARRRVQDSTLTDVAQADTRLAGAEAQLASLQSTLDISRGAYLRVIGILPVDLQPLPELDGLPASFDQALDVAIVNNPTLAAAQYDERSSAANVASVRGERRPTIAATATAGYVGPLTSLSRDEYRETVTGGLTITQPLFAAGAIRSRIRQAEVLNQADQVAIDGARRDVLQTVVQAWSQLAAARLTLVSTSRQVASAQIAFAGTERERQYGIRTTIEVLNAEQELQSAQLTLLQTRYTEYVLRAALLAAVGVLRAQTLVPTIVATDPEAEFRRVRNTGRTPLEAVAGGLDRIGSANPSPPASAALTGAAVAAPASAEPLAARPGPELTRAPLTPITKSRLVPASELPGGLPRTGYIPPRDPSDMPAPADEPRP